MGRVQVSESDPRVGFGYKETRPVAIPNHLGMWVDGGSSYPSTWREVVQAIAPTMPVRGITYCRHVMWG